MIFTYSKRQHECIFINIFKYDYLAHSCSASNVPTHNLLTSIFMICVTPYCHIKFSYIVRLQVKQEGLFSSCAHTETEILVFKYFLR